MNKLFIAVSILFLTACEPAGGGSDYPFIVKCETGDGIVTHVTDFFSVWTDGSTIHDLDDGIRYEYSIAVKCWRVKN